MLAKSKGALMQNITSLKWKSAMSRKSKTLQKECLDSGCVQCWPFLQFLAKFRKKTEQFWLTCMMSDLSCLTRTRDSLWLLNSSLTHTSRTLLSQKGTICPTAMWLTNAKDVQLNGLLEVTPPKWRKRRSRKREERRPTLPSPSSVIPFLTSSRPSTLTTKKLKKTKIRTKMKMIKKMISVREWIKTTILV